MRCRRVAQVNGGLSKKIIHVPYLQHSWVNVTYTKDCTPEVVVIRLMDPMAMRVGQRPTDVSGERDYSDNSRRLFVGSQRSVAAQCITWSFTMIKPTPNPPEGDCTSPYESIDSRTLQTLPSVRSITTVNRVLDNVEVTQSVTPS